MINLYLIPCVCHYLNYKIDFFLIYKNCINYMGIKQLNKLCIRYCRKKTKSIYKIHLSDLYGKKICIDTMIYLYKFITTEQLLENMFKLCTLFKKYNITPIFIFDGKAPIEKKKGIRY